MVVMERRIWKLRIFCEKIRRKATVFEMLCVYRDGKCLEKAVDEVI